MTTPRPGNPAVPTRLPPAGRRAGGPPWMNMGMPAEKSMDFGPSARRLARRLRPHRLRVLVAVALALLSVGFTVVGPRILGRATDTIFAGVIGKQLPAGMSLTQVVAEQRASGNGRLADLLARTHVIPGLGIDFTRLGHLLLLALSLYAIASVLSWLQGFLIAGIVQRMVFKLRAEAADKLNRLPLPYFDKQPRGELLSRVTNDIDNIQQSVQQTLSQLLTSLLTVVGVLGMMFWVSPVLALVALVSVPLSIVVTKRIAKRSQKQFVAQWTQTGSLNGEIEEAFTGHELVKVFGRQREVEASFAAQNNELFRASFGAQFASGTIMPSMMFIG
ncbi:MAG: ATP-binding cassette, subfamily multidrug efflux pump, partial [Frankiaceae bacterium]|nr:ATP-binding cassette, subfamily multidrug efflux pump [Frankiaceae bacterium]